MNRFRTGAIALLTACSLHGMAVMAQQQAATKAAQPEKATLDAPVRDFKLQDVTHDAKEGDKPDAAKIALSDYKGKKPVLLFFMSEKCQTTWRYEKRMGKLEAKYGAKDVAFLGVRCSANDTCESIRKFAEAKNFDMPILNDADGAMSRYFKIRCTPTFALIDKQGVLRYLGSFDNAPDEPDVTKSFVPAAIVAVLDNKSVATKSNAPFG
jgi:peroxiredoxin